MTKECIILHYLVNIQGQVNFVCILNLLNIRRYIAFPFFENRLRQRESFQIQMGTIIVLLCQVFKKCFQKPTSLFQLLHFVFASSTICSKKIYIYVTNGVCGQVVFSSSKHWHNGEMWLRYYSVQHLLKIIILLSKHMHHIFDK